MTAHPIRRPDAPTYPAAYPQHIDWAAPLPARPMSEIFEEAAARFAGRPMIDFLGKRYDYAEVEDLVFRAAKGLQQIGVKKGDRVGLFLPNAPVFIIVYYAALKIGAVAVCINPLYAEQEVRALLDDAGVEVAVTLDLNLLYGRIAPMLGTTRLRRLVVACMADFLPWPKNWLFPVAKRKEIAAWPKDDRHIAFSRLIANDGRPTAADIDPEKDLAVLQYTGGTTGTPKGAMLTHANLAANTEQCARWCAESRPGEERMLGVLPFFHVFAMTAVMNMSIRIGAEIIMLPRYDLTQTLETITAKKPTLFPAVPTIYTAINHRPDRDKYDLSSIRFCISGGAPLPVEVREAFMRNTGCVLVEGYGLTESSPVACCNPQRGANKAGSIGLPLPGTAIDIVSLEDGETLLGVGEKGEVCVRGPQVMAGYWNRPEETAEALRGGRLHTGDVGYVDEDGYVFIVDRIKDMILSKGYNVYPRNVEEAIHRHPAVAECVVAGLPDDYRGQVVKAYVRIADGAELTSEELTDFLQDKLSPMETPKIIEFRSELPRTMIGKLSRKALLDEEARRRGENVG